MSTERPRLTARWTDLVLLNFAVPVEVVERLTPPGTEPDLHEGRSYASVVAFWFDRIRLLGLPIPGHTRFVEINLRFYVRRFIDGEYRRGVVFAREIVPRRAVALVANWWYHENYIARPMLREVHKTGTALAPGDTVDYRWQSNAGSFRGRMRGHRQATEENSWNRVAGRVAMPLATPPAGSLDEFFVEHYWGYARGRDGRTREYRVAHPPWRVAPLDEVTWQCEPGRMFDAPLGEYLSVSPASAIVADGSCVEVFGGRKI